MPIGLARRHLCSAGCPNQIGYPLDVDRAVGLNDDDLAETQRFSCSQHFSKLFEQCLVEVTWMPISAGVAPSRLLRWTGAPDFDHRIDQRPPKPCADDVAGRRREP